MGVIAYAILIYLNQEFLFFLITRLKGQFDPLLSLWDSSYLFFFLEDPTYFSLWFGMGLVTWLFLLMQRTREIRVDKTDPPGKNGKRNGTSNSNRS